MLAPYTPFYPGSYHLGEGRRFAVATEAANVVDRIFAQTAGNVPLATERLTRELSAHAVAIEKLAQQIEKETGWTYMGIDATPAPLREVSAAADDGCRHNNNLEWVGAPAGQGGRNV